jgi:hypothetical protein
MKSLEKNYFKPNELENIYKQLLSTGQQKNLNAYDCFIAERRANPYPAGTKTERHHIIPRHAKGSNDPSNLIALSVKDHMVAHWILWKVTGSEKDLQAYVFRVSTSEEREAIRVQKCQAYIERMRESKALFFDSAFQSEQGKKGGPKGGAANTDAQFAARQKVGKTWGPIIGALNKGERKKEFSEKYSIWHFLGHQNIGGDFQGKNQRNRPSPSATSVEFYLLVEPKPNYITVMDVLDQFCPGSMPPISIPAGNNSRSTMYKLVNEDKRIYGWKLYAELTCSEVEAGILEQPPLSSLGYFDESDLAE